MSFDPQGEWGLRHRLRVALRQGYSYEVLGILLNVDAATLEAYLTDSTYVLGSLDTALIIDNLFNLEAPEVSYDVRPMTGGCTITYIESAYWTQDQVDGLMQPEGATCFKVHFMAPSQQHRPMSGPLRYFADMSMQEEIATLVGDHLDRLICVVCYAYQDVEA